MAPPHCIFSHGFGVGHPPNIPAAKKTSGLMLTNHLAYIVLDGAGFVCRENGGASRMAKGEMRKLSFDTSSVCSATGVLLENGGRYAITIKAREAHWYDRTIETSPSGFY